MSAPPIAITRWMPIRPDTAVTASRAGSDCGPAPTKITPSQTQARSIAKLSRCRPGRSSGLLPITPCSLPQAITDPVNVSAPMNTPMKVSMSWIVCSAPTSVLAGCSLLLIPTSTAAAPTKLCRIATSCGIAVIETRVATTAPMSPAISTAPMTTGEVASPT